MQFVKKVIVFVDAACKRNPGNAAIGILLFDENGNLLEKFSKKIGKSTNNRAECFAILKGMEIALKYSRKQLFVFSDSKLLIKQINGEFRIKNKHLLKLIKQIKLTELLFEKIKFSFVRKKKNKLAHKLAKKALS